MILLLSGVIVMDFTARCDSRDIYIYWHLRDNNCQEKNIAKGKLRKNLLLILRTFLHESVKTSAIHYKSVLSNNPTVIVYCGNRSTVVLDQNMASH